MSAKTEKGRSLFFLLALLGAGALFVAGVALRGQVAAQQTQTPDSAGEAAATRVRVARIERRLMRVQAEFHGFLAPFTELTVAAQVPGEIVQQWVEASDGVTIGQALFKIDAAIREIEHEQALAAMERATSEYELAEANDRRIQALPGETSTSMERIEGEAHTRAARADQRRAQAVVRQAALLLERTIVRSPLDGVVSRIHLRRGEFTQQGQPLLDVIEMDRLKLLAEIDDREIIWVRVGQRVALSTNTFPGERFDGTVHRIYPQSLPTSHKFEVEIELRNPDRRLRPGFFMTGTITRPEQAAADADRAGILIIPREAVYELYGQHFCYRVRPAGHGGEAGSTLVAERRVVVVWPTPSDPRSLHVVEGVAEGDLVVTKGIQHLSGRAAVRITD